MYLTRPALIVHPLSLVERLVELSHPTACGGGGMRLAVAKRFLSLTPRYVSEPQFRGQTQPKFLPAQPPAMAKTHSAKPWSYPTLARSQRPSPRPHHASPQCTSRTSTSNSGNPFNSRYLCLFIVSPHRRGRSEGRWGGLLHTNHYESG